MSAETTSPRKRPRHLMDPTNPANNAVRSAREPMSLSQVQKWVMSTLAVSTVFHMAGGVVLAAYVNDRTPNQIGLLVVSALFGMLGIVAGLLIHGRRPLSPWLALGLLPAAIGAWVIFG